MRPLAAHQPAHLLTLTSRPGGGAGGRRDATGTTGTAAAAAASAAGVAGAANVVPATARLLPLPPKPPPPPLLVEAPARGAAGAPSPERTAVEGCISIRPRSLITAPASEMGETKQRVTS